MTFLLRNALSLACLLAMVGVSVFIYPSLPEQVPSHYNLQGVVDNTSPRWLMVTLVPLLYAVVIGLVNVLVHRSPETFSMPNSKRAMDTVVMAVGVLMVSVHLSLLVDAGSFETFSRFFSFGMAVFLVLTGNVMGKTEQNFFLGIRLPWSLASTENWKATHRLAGKLMVVFGLLLFICTAVYPSVLVTVLMTVCPLAVAAGYSPLYYFKHEKPR